MLNILTKLNNNANINSGYHVVARPRKGEHNGVDFDRAVCGAGRASHHYGENRSPQLHRLPWLRTQRPAAALSESSRHRTLRG